VARRRQQEAQPVADADPWRSFLEAIHLVGGTSSAEPESSGWELQLVRDPLFEKFLRYGPGRSGVGPKTAAEFLSLPESDKRFYARVFEEWKRVVRERRIPVEELD